MPISIILRHSCKMLLPLLTWLAISKQKHITLQGQAFPSKQGTGLGYAFLALVNKPCAKLPPLADFMGQAELFSAYR